VEKRYVVAIVGLVLLIMVGGTGVLGYKQGWISPPELTVEVTATWPDGTPLESASVAALGKVRGETDSEGKLSFGIQSGIGEEVTVWVRLARPGLEVEPWEGAFVVRKWDRSDPESVRYALKAVLEPKSVSATVRVVADGEPVPGAAVAVGREAERKTGSDGQLTVDLGARSSRSARISVKASRFEPWSREVTLRAGETFLVSLERVGAVSSQITAAYETLGRVVRVSGAEVRMGSRELGRTDADGRFRFTVPEQGVKVNVRKAGFLPDPSERSLPGGRSAVVVVPLFPERAPTYRLVVLPPANGSPGNAALATALPAIEDKLADYLFSYEVFERVDATSFLRAMRDAKRTETQVLETGWAGTPLEKMADAVVHSEAALDEELVVSVQVVSVSGRRLGAFAETEGLSRIRRIAEQVAEKVVGIFPFEGYVTSVEEKEIHANLGSSGDRGVGRDARIEIWRWSGSVPPKLELKGRGRIASVNRDGSRIELESGGGVAVGDKALLLPRAEDAAFTARLDLTVLAGAEGSEVPFSDVNVYRDGSWVGTTSEEGKILVPVASRSRHRLLFVKGGIRPHSEEIQTGNGVQSKTVVVPQTMTLLRIESEPSGARVFVDGRDLGVTPVEAPVVMGFRRVRVEAQDGWRPFDEVLELTSAEESFTGSRRIVLKRDVLKEAELLLEAGQVDEATVLLAEVGPDHPDYSAAHNLLGGVYLDRTRAVEQAIEEFESVLSRPENRELVNKRFAVTFLNLGRAYFATDTPEGYRRAIQNLEIARDNKRFFPSDRHDVASHDTLYFLALASHKLYHAEPDGKLLRDTSKRWKDYFDFFPESLQAEPDVRTAREGAEQFYAEIRHELGE
jgi:hypothetical protein